jgi:hypothetical protein
LTGLTTASRGTYWCVVSYDGTPHESAHGALDVTAPLQVLTGPSGGFKEIGSAHTFTVTVAGGYAPLSYVWKKDGSPIGTASTYAITSLDDADTGSYLVEVSDDNGALAVSPATPLTVVAAVPVAGIAALTALALGLAIGARAALRRSSRD